jgi:RND family efflux transporter MFP subunit
MLLVLTSELIKRQSMTSDKNRPSRSLPAWLGVLLAGLVVLGVTGLLKARVALQEDPPPKIPLTVTTAEYRLQNSYQRELSYLGVVVSGHKANLAFEIPGRIEALPYRQGSPVEAGDIIARLDDASLRTRQQAIAANLKRVQAELELARLKARRQKDLQASGAVSKEAFDETRLRATALEAQEAMVMAELATIALDLEKSRLVAPYDGVIADRYVHEGAVISPGVPVVRVVEIAQLEAHVGVAASRAQALESGTQYTLRMRGQDFDAILLSVRPDVDPVTRSATAVLALPAEISALDGEPVSMLLQETIPAAGGWLPMTALQEGQRGLWTVLAVSEVDGHHSVLREAVEVLAVQGNQVYVRGTLDDGALVVATGTHRMAPGARVILAEAD